jgi:phage terminase Nu1 subunit (DNA packaging protein)
VSRTAALLDEVTDELYARHTADVEAAGRARREYEERRGKVHQDDELWEAWSAAFVEWFVVERVESGAIDPRPLAARTYRELADDDPRAACVRALVTSQRSLFEVRAIRRGRVELLDLLGGAEVHVVEHRALHGVELGDVAELRLVGVPGEVRFGRTFIYHPRAARDAIVERARSMFAAGASRRDVIDQIAHARTQLARYRHMSPARLYRAGTLGSRIA